MRPDLGVRRGELATIGEGGFHRRVAVLFEQGDGESALGQRVGGSDTGDTATDQI